MKLVYRQKSNGDIFSVETPHRYVTEKRSYDDVLKQIENINNNLKEGQLEYKFIEITDPLLENILSMLLGERQYKKSKEMDDIVNSVDSFKESLDEIESDLDSCSNCVYEMQDNVDRLIKQIREKFGLKDD